VPWLYFNYLVMMAWARGLIWRWPAFPKCRKSPYNPCGVSTGLTWDETKTMFYRHDWQPWCFQKTTGLRIARNFRTP
jgi:hypothetical protein